MSIHRAAVTWILLVLPLVPSGAWEWPGTPVAVGDVAESPGVPIDVDSEGLRPVHDGVLLFVSNRLLVIDHGDDLWSIYALHLSDRAAARLASPPFDAAAGEALLLPSDLREPVIWLSMWDQRTRRWVDPRLLLAVPESTVQKIILVGRQEGRIETLANLAPGRVEFLIGTGFSRLESPQEIALLINGETIGRVRLDEIAGAPVRDFLGDRYLEVGLGTLRAGMNHVEVLVFDYAGNRRVHESTLTTRPTP